MADDETTGGVTAVRRRSPRTLAARGAGLMGAAGLAITQPVLDLFGRNPEFFIAGRYGPRQIITFGLVVALAPGAVAMAGTTLAWLAHPRLGAAVHSVALAGFAFLFGLVLAGEIGLTTTWLAIAAAAAVAIAVVWLHHVRAGVRTLASYLAVGNVVFLVMFLFASPTSDVIDTGSINGQVGRVSVPPLEGPVLLVILDEFPVSTLLRPDGTINDERYPNFARLASSSTWFRDTASPASRTTIAAPPILTGNLAGKGALPSYEDHPRNFFTLFGDTYPVHLYESVTNMCPSTVCEPPPAGALRDALQDGAIVYGHRMLPDSLADELPAIDHSWGGFGEDIGATQQSAASESPETELGQNGFGRWNSLDPFDRSPVGQYRSLVETVRRIDARPSINLVHVALPHHPWTLTPWGTSLTQYRRDLAADRTAPNFDDASVQFYQLHALQVGATDVAIGEMIDHLQAVGAWDRALVVVTSDHGTSVVPPDLGRKLTDTNREWFLRVPLFIKAPGQTIGEVRDTPAQTLDILPSIIDLLDAAVDWEFDGHSLYDGSEPHTKRRISAGIEPTLEVAARHASDVGGDDWTGLIARGEHRNLVGKPVSELAVGEPSTLRWVADDEAVFDSLPTEDGGMPHLLTGIVESLDGDRPPEVLVAVNGTLAGVIGAYTPSDGSWRFTGVIGPHFVPGGNTVEAYEVASTRDGPVLRPIGVI